MTEHPRDRIARIFGMGKYGEQLADQLLEDYRNIIADYLEGNDLPHASNIVRLQEWEND